MAMISRHYKLPVAALERIDDACEQFERSWQDGNPQSIESLIKDIHDSQERSALLAELLALELDYKSRQGGPPDLDEYLTRFASDQSHVRRVFDEVCGPPEIQQKTPLGSGWKPSSRHTPSSRSSAFGSADDSNGTQFSEGRYVVMEKLGVGGFATVFRAFDQSLQRDVAIKVPHASRADEYDLESYLSEARLVAKLDHPAIVPVYDTGRDANGVCYVVSKLIQGQDLAQLLRENRPRVDESVALIARVAEALTYAHRRGLVHRDLKPANILVDSTGLAYVTDFGLALETDAPTNGGAFVGTPAYMSPEQAASESHLIDHRTDIFSLGVIFYELLTGRRPFIGSRRREILDSIREGSCVAPSQLVSGLPSHLDRVCMRALAPRISDRYATAHEFRKDLLKEDSPSESTLRSMAASVPKRQGIVLPRGLRSFDESDAEHFVDLLPGPYDDQGLPTVISFWLNRILPKASHPFRVGLLAGRSGSGKSSLVKAGLIPRLTNGVRGIFVEASAEHTEATLLETLHREFPSVAGCHLIETFAELRRLEDSPKIVVFIDQFEQWLQSNDVTASELVAALRHCDGHHVQAILMVRDEFGMMAARLLYELDVRVEQGNNFATVTTFPSRHARMTLARFGQALGQLPESITECSQEQQAFLDSAIDLISEQGRVMPVKLALFTEIMKDRTWDAHSMAGIAQRGLGVAFLEQNFGDHATHPECRLHRAAARQVLRALLPARNIEIKGSLRTREELLEVSGHARHPEQFHALIQLLDRELRLVTPAEIVRDAHQPMSKRSSSESSTSTTERGFLLAHDFMVAPLREWLTQQDKQTLRGRAELCLAERASWWENSRANQQLPSLVEWLSIHLFARSRRRSLIETEMMGAANHKYLSQAAALAMLVTLSLFGWRHFAAKRDARSLVDQIVSARQSDLPQLVEQAAMGSKQLQTALREKSTASALTTDQRLNVLVALSRRTGRLQPQLMDAMMAARVGSYANALECLVPLEDSLLPALESRLNPSVEDQAATQDSKFRAACGIAMMRPERVPEQLDTELVGQLMRRNLLELPVWAELLTPLKDRLHRPLKTHFLRADEPQAQHVATTILAQLYDDDPNALLSLVRQSRGSQLAVFLPAVKNHRKVLLPKLSARWSDSFAPPQLPYPTVPIATSRLVEQTGGSVTMTSAFATRLRPTEFEQADESLLRAGYTLEQKLRIPGHQSAELETDEPCIAAIWRRGRRATHHHANDGQAAIDDEQRTLDLDDSAVRQIRLNQSTTSHAKQNLYFSVDARYRVSKANALIPPDLAWTAAASFDHEPHDCLDVIREHGRVRMPPAALEQGDEFTFEAWVMDWSGGLLTQSSGDSALWISVGQDGHSLGSIGWMSADGNPACRLSLGVTKLQGLNHIALVFDGTQATCYLNGEACDSAEADAPSKKTSSKHNRQTGLVVSRPLKRHSKNWGSGKLLSLRVSSSARYSESFIPESSLQFDESTLTYLNVTREQFPITESAMPEERLSKSANAQRFAQEYWHVFLSGFDAASHQEAASQMTEHEYRPVWFANRLTEDASEASRVQSRWSRTRDPLLTPNAIRNLANLAVCLWELGEFDQVSPAFALRSNNELRSQLITRLADAHCQPSFLLQRLRNEPDAGVRQALILALGEFGIQAIPEKARITYADDLRTLYHRERNAGVHSAIEFLFKRWNLQVTVLDDTQKPESLEHGDWTIQAGHKFVVIETPNPLPNHNQDRTQFPSKFGIAIRPLSNRKYDAYAEFTGETRPKRSPSKPVAYTTFYDAAGYCNWLSQQDGIPESEWCFVDSNKGYTSEPLHRLVAADDYLQRRGYRLPTVEEWRLACGGQATTYYFFGNSKSLTGQYVWFSDNSTGILTDIGMKKPNGYGLVRLVRQRQRMGAQPLQRTRKWFRLRIGS